MAVAACNGVNHRPIVKKIKKMTEIIFLPISSILFCLDQFGEGGDFFMDQLFT